MFNGVSKPSQTSPEKQQNSTFFIAVMVMLVGYAIGLKIETKSSLGFKKIIMNLQNFIKKKLFLL